MPRPLVFAALCWVAMACTDEGIVGTRAAALCEPGCDGNERCHPELSLCVQCVSDTDCARSSDGPLCDLASNVCRACDAGDTCPVPECEPPDEPDDLLDDDCDLDEGDGSIDDDDDDDDDDDRPTP